MAIDALSKLALARTQAAASDIEAQLSIKNGQRPVVMMLQYAKIEAASALGALVSADPEDPKLIRKLQNEVARFDDLCRWLREVVIAGKEAEEELTDADRNEMIEILGQDEEGQQTLLDLGLIKEGDVYAPDQ